MKISFWLRKNRLPLAHISVFQPLLDIMQELERNADGFSIAAQRGDRVRVAMIVRAAAEE